MQMTLFQQGNSIFHRFDPRAKILLLLFFLVYIFLPFGLIVHGTVLLLLIIASAVSTDWRDMFSPIIAIWPILILIALLTPPFYREDPIGITIELLLRFTSISYLFTLFFKTTEMSMIILTLRWFRLPYNAALVITMALRFIPYLGGVYHQIQDAHKLRMGSAEKINRFYQKIRSLIPVLTSVMIYAIKTIPELSMSLEHRGFGIPRKTSRLRVYKSLKNGHKLFTHMGISVIIAVIFILTPSIFN